MQRTSKAGFLVATLLAATPAALPAAPPVGATFSYQGRLADQGLPADGAYDFAFTAYAQELGGTPLAPDVLAEDIAVSSGLFSTQLNFLSINYLDGVWIEIAVRPGDSTDPHTPLAGRVYITPSPAAMWAINADSVGGLAPGDLAPAEHTHAALHTPDGSMQIVTVDNSGDVTLPGGAQVSTVFSGNSTSLEVDGAGIRFDKFVGSPVFSIQATEGTERLSISGADDTGGGTPASDVTISGGGSLDSSQFGFGGEVRVLGGSVDNGTAGNASLEAGDALGTGGNAGQVFIRGGDGIGGNAGGVTIDAGDSTAGSTDGGEVILRGGQSQGRLGGSVRIDAGSTNSLSAGGGGLFLAAGSGGGAGGPVEIEAGYSPDGAGGDMTLEGGGSDIGDGGNMTLRAGGTVSGTGGDMVLEAGQGSSGDGGDTTVLAGFSENGLAGKLRLQGGQSFNGTGGDAEFHGGSSTFGAAGNVTVRGGASGGTNPGGFLAFIAGDGGAGSQTGPGGEVFVGGGNGSTGGPVLIAGGNGTQNGGNVEVRAGNGPSSGNAPGGELSLLGGIGSGLFGGSGGAGGPVRIEGGRAFGSDSNVGGDIILSAGAGASGDPADDGIVDIHSLVSILRDGAKPDSGAILQVGGITPGDGNGAFLSDDGVWTNASDAEKKTVVSDVDAREVLDRVLALPLKNWRVRGTQDAPLHMGPMAQDFFAAFGLGASDRHIGSVDADGVALAAIQGLHAEIQDRDARIADLEARLARLEALLTDTTQGRTD